MHPRLRGDQKGRCLSVTGALAQSLAILFALAGAACYSIAAVTQQQAASKLTTRFAVDPAVLIRLAKRRRWQLSLIAVAGGYGLQAAALGVGRLVVVEPVFPAGLLFALMLAAHAEGRRLKHSEWTAAVAAVGGMVLFLIAAQPSSGRTTAPTNLLVLAAGAAAGVAAVCCLIAMRVMTAHRALVLSIGGGVGAGVTDALTKTNARLTGLHGFGVLADPRLWLLAVVGLMTFTMQQNAFRAAGLAASLPAFNVLEPVTGSFLGLLIYHEHVGTSPLRIAVEVVAVLAAVWGIVQLANSVIAATARLTATAPATPSAATVPPSDSPV
jgi:hypothetical protein